MISTQHWKPDTCGCTIEQKFDYADETNPVLVEETFVTRCAVHTDTVDASDVHEENVVKNMALRAIVELHPALKADDHEYGFDDKRNFIIKPHMDVPDEAVKELHAELYKLLSEIYPKEAAELIKRVKVVL